MMLTWVHDVNARAQHRHRPPLCVQRRPVRLGIDSARQPADHGHAGAGETILLRDGWLTEGTASSVFIVNGGVILTPPESHLMLPGITYEVVLELVGRQDMPHEVRPVSEAELRAADEIWITSSTKEVMAVTRLDGHAVGDGGPGPVYRRVLAAYQDYKRTVMRAGKA